MIQFRAFNDFIVVAIIAGQGVMDGGNQVLAFALDGAGTQEGVARAWFRLIAGFWLAFAIAREAVAAIKELGCDD